MPGFNIPFVPCPGESSVVLFNGPSITQEYARAHRYVLEVLQPLGTRNNGILLSLSKCGRPAPEFEKLIVHSAQDEIPRPGKTSWKEIDFTFYEKVDGINSILSENTTASLVYKWWSSIMMNMRTSLHNPPSFYLKDCVLQMLEGNGYPIWTYHIYDAWPVKVSPSELAYSDSDIATISVTLAYARAVESRTRGG